MYIHERFGYCVLVCMCVCAGSGLSLISGLSAHCALINSYVNCP